MIAWTKVVPTKLEPGILNRTQRVTKEHYISNPKFLVYQELPPNTYIFVTGIPIDFNMIDRRRNERLRVSEDLFLSSIETMLMKLTKPENPVSQTLCPGLTRASPQTLPFLVAASLLMLI